MADIRAARNIADGYFVNALLAGPLIYWPDRPKRCRLNFKRVAEGDSIEVGGQSFRFDSGGGVGRDECMNEQKEFLVKQTPEKDAAKEVQVAALQRVFANLDLAGEQRRGKPVWGVSIIRATEFSYDKEARKVSMEKLPNTYCVMNGSGITVNGLMIYQEPRVRKKKDKFLWIPRRNKRGDLVFSKNPRLDKIPENSYAFDRVVDAFADASVPVGSFRANLRRWNPGKSPQLVKELTAIPQFAGFNFEGGMHVDLQCNVNF